jgi:ribonuclease HIII
LVSWIITIILDLYGLFFVGTQSIQFSRKKLEEIRQSLQNRGIPVAIGNTPYELFRVQKEGYKCVAYRSGKLTYSTTHDLNNILDQKPQSQEEEYFEIRGGTDEAGKGEWYGPLVVAIALLTPEQLNKGRQLGIKDSKLLSPSQIETVATKILEEKIDHFTLILPPPKYNKIYLEYQRSKKTLNDLLVWSHSQVIEKYYHKYSKKRVQIVVDAFDEARLTKHLLPPPSRWVIEQRTRGESALPVAAASILARARFLQEVYSLEEKHKITLFKTTPSDIPKNLLPDVAKIHFNNVQRVLKV